MYLKADRWSVERAQIIYDMLRRAEKKMGPEDKFTTFFGACRRLLSEIQSIQGSLKFYEAEIARRDGEIDDLLRRVRVLEHRMQVAENERGRYQGPASAP